MLFQKSLLNVQSGLQLFVPAQRAVGDMRSTSDPGQRFVRAPPRWNPLVSFTCTLGLQHWRLLYSARRALVLPCYGSACLPSLVAKCLPPLPLLTQS